MKKFVYAVNAFPSTPSRQEETLLSSGQLWVARPDWDRKQLAKLRARRAYRYKERSSTIS